jgi:hypothetical protein
MVAQGIGRLLEFQHGRGGPQAGRRVRQRGQELDGRREADGAAPGMRHAFDAVRRGERRDLAALADAAGGADIGLDDVHRLLRDDVAEAPAGEVVLTARHRHVEGARDLHVALVVLGADRLLEPQQVQLLHGAAEADGLGDGEAVVRVHGELDVGPDCLPHGGDARQVQLRVAQADLHLDRAEAHGCVFLGFLHRFLDQAVHVDEVEAGGICLNLGAVGAADQLVDGLVHRAAHDVPQRDVDARKGRDAEALRAIVLDAVIKVLPHHLDVEGVAADDAGAVLRLDQRLVHGGGPVALAPASDPLVGRDLDDARGARGVDPAARRDEGLLHLAL